MIGGMIHQLAAHVRQMSAGRNAADQLSDCAASATEISKSLKSPNPNAQIPQSPNHKITKSTYGSVIPCRASMSACWLVRSRPSYGRSRSTIKTSTSAKQKATAMAAGDRRVLDRPVL
jgi:hypothetical protein